MQEFRGYYEVSTGWAPGLGIELFAHASNAMENNPHWQSSVEILCMLRGGVTVTVEGRDYPMAPGDVLVIDSHLTHHYHGGQPGGLSLLVAIGENLLHRDSDGVIYLTTVGPGALRRDDPDVARLRSLCGRMAELCMPLHRRQLYQDMGVRAMIEAAEHGDTLPPLDDGDMRVDSQTWHGARAAMNEAVALLLRHTLPVQGRAGRVPTEFVQCLQYVEHHLAERFTATDLGRACGFSRRSVFRMFQKYMGVPLNDYVTWLRVQAAQRILEASDATAADAAAQVGLSESQFYRVFREAMGVAPGDWQRQTPSREQLRMPLVVMSPLNQFAADMYQDSELDWDWIAGRKGWDFPEREDSLANRATEDA